jgi:hypothetical protein
MTDLNPNWKWIVASLVFALLLVSTIGVGVYSAHKRQEDSHLRKDWLTAVPRVQSHVKDLEIINPRIVREGELTGVAFQVSNKSARPVMAIRIGSGNASISKDGLEDDEHPRVIIQPFGVLDAEMFEVTKGAPLAILSATFQDSNGSIEDGDTHSLELTKKLRERAKKLRAEKEKHSPDWRPNQ